MSKNKSDNPEEQIHRNDLADAIKNTPHLSSKDRIASLREIVETKEASRLEGILIDTTTAQVIIQIYDHVNDANKDRLRDMPLRKMGQICWQLFSRHGKIGV